MVGGGSLCGFAAIKLFPITCAHGGKRDEEHCMEELFAGVEK